MTWLAGFSILVPALIIAWLLALIIDRYWTDIIGILFISFFAYLIFYKLPLIIGQAVIK